MFLAPFSLCHTAESVVVSCHPAESVSFYQFFPKFLCVYFCFQSSFLPVFSYVCGSFSVNTLFSQSSNDCTFVGFNSVSFVVSVGSACHTAESFSGHFLRSRFPCHPAQSVVVSCPIHESFKLSFLLVFSYVCSLNVFSTF